MKFVIVTGMSGAGKSTAMKMMEDMGFFCVDNLPIPLFEKFVELFESTHSSMQNVAVGVDVRSGADFEDFKHVLDDMEKKEFDFQILFLDSEAEVLVKRYKETRRSHPLANGERIDKGIERERKKLDFLRKRADYIIDIGPEGGDKGGTIVACGTPEEVAEVKESYTGYYVKKMLERDKKLAES